MFAPAFAVSGPDLKSGGARCAVQTRNPGRRIVHGHMSTNTPAGTDMPSEQQLSGVLSEFARTMVTDFPIQGILDRLVLRIVDVLPITAAGVTLISPGADPRYVAASSASALRFEQLQTELGEGPCVAAYQTGEAVSVPDLREEHRFPRFAPQALAAGLAAVFTFPLRQGEAQLGALDLYRDSSGPLDEGTMTAAQTLADVAAAYLLNAQARADLEDSSGRAKEMSLHDALTGLPNRVLLLERIAHALLRSRRSGNPPAVLFADLDQFKMVNDVHGHRAGDELLVAVAQRLAGQLRPGDTLARLSGDEFVILCEDLATTAELETIAARIGAVLAEPVVLSSGACVATPASIGVAFASSADDLPDQLLHNADLAMYQAKRRGGAHHESIDVKEQVLTDQRARLQRDVRHACERGELRIDYQPIVSTIEARVVGVEALVRWAHPSLGLILPATLIPLAEQSDVISEVGRWVLEQACSDLERWREHHQADDLMMAVNVSAHQLMSPEFAATVQDVLLRSGTNARHLTLEVTETIFVHDDERALVVLRDLKELGTMLALDDFGSGYSSLGYLKRFPVDVVKIDASFVADLGQGEASHTIVAAITDLAHALELSVTAEGVESGWQHEALAALNCDTCQGFYFARPMPADAFDALMSHRIAGDTMRLPVLVPAS
jgi:diguanylate cyclase (GGDEF)-like protein